MTTLLSPYYTNSTLNKHNRKYCILVLLLPQPPFYTYINSNDIVLILFLIVLHFSKREIHNDYKFRASCLRVR